MLGQVGICRRQLRIVRLSIHDAGLIAHGFDEETEAQVVVRHRRPVTAIDAQVALCSYPGITPPLCLTKKPSPVFPRVASKGKSISDHIMKSNLLILRGLMCLLALPAAALAEANPPPVRIAIVGLVHGHARGFIPGAISRPDIQVVGMVEPNRKVAAKYAALFHLDTNLFFPSIEALLARTNAQAVAAFTSTFDHRRVVEECAAHGIHVMMEKPLAVNLEHACAMEAAATKGGIQVLSKSGR
jgi:hypothetical protein